MTEKLLPRYTQGFCGRLTKLLLAAMESLRLALTSFPTLVASAPPSRIDRQLREIAAALATLLSPQDTGETLPEQQTALEDAVHLLLDTFCRAHIEDHMSDHMKLGSWRLPYVAMLHSHVSLHLPLIKQLELLLHSSGTSLSPVQCSALCSFMLFMNPCQILPRDQVSGNQSGLVDDPLKDVGVEMQTDRKDMDEGFQWRENQFGNCNFRVLFEWRWEACVRVQSSEVLYKEHANSQVQDEALELESAKVQLRGLGNHWMEQFWDSFLIDSETSVLWATRFAASYLRNMALYWEHILFNKDCRETWLLTDLARQLKNITLVGPIFVALVPQNMVVFLMWLQQRLDFASHFGELAEFANLKKAFVLCETVLASPLGVLLRSTKVSLPLHKFFELELRTGWKEWLLTKSCHPFLRHVVWGGTSPGDPDGCSWGLLWKEYGGDRARACIALSVVFLCKQYLEFRQLLDARSNHELPKNSWSGTKEQCVRADPSVFQNLPQLLWLEESEASPAEVFILQIIVELSSNLDLQCGPWFLEAAFDCLGNQARLENAIFMHSGTCAYAHVCKSWHYRSGICSAHRLKSCIAALPPSHSISYERLYKMEKVFMFCWLGDGPFSIDFAVQLLSYFQITQTSVTFLKAENQWSTLLLATWVRFFNDVGAPILSLHHMVDGIDLGSILAHLHTSQQLLASSSKDVSLDIHSFRVATKAMPQLAAVTLIESLFTSTPFTSLSLREGFLAKLATEASRQQHEVSIRVLDILRRVVTEERPGSRMENHDKTDPEDGALFLKFLMFNLVDLLSMAAISCPNLILQKWTAFEYKRKWLITSKTSTLLSLASIELELDERAGKPQSSTWDILLEWVVTSITVRPDAINHLNGEVLVESPGVGPRALALILVFSALPKETVLYLRQSVSISWSLLLSQMRTGMENGFRKLVFGDRKSMISSIKAEMDIYLLQLQEYV